MSAPYRIIPDGPRRWTIGHLMIGVALVALVLGCPRVVLTFLVVTGALWWLPFLAVFGVPMLARQDRRLWGFECSVASFPVVVVALVHIELSIGLPTHLQKDRAMLLHWTTRMLLAEAPAMLLGTLLVLIASLEKRRDSSGTAAWLTGLLMPIATWFVCWLVFRTDPLGAFAHHARLG